MGLGIGVIGYWKGSMGWPMRALFIVAALLLIVPETISDIAGLAMLFALMFAQFKKSGKALRAAN